LKLIARKIIKDLFDPTVPICRAIGITSSEEVRLMVRRSKYYVVPRFLRYRQYEEPLDPLQLKLNQSDYTDLVSQALETFIFQQMSESMKA